MELSPYVLIFVLMIFYIILGMFLDGISAVVLTMAIIEPMIRQAGFDMIWFGIFLVVVVEMAQITPPVGLIFLCFKEWQTRIWVTLQEVHFHYFY